MCYLVSTDRLDNFYLKTENVIHFSDKKGAILPLCKSGTNRHIVRQRERKVKKKTKERRGRKKRKEEKKDYLPPIKEDLKAFID